MWRVSREQRSRAQARLRPAGKGGRGPGEWHPPVLEENAEHEQSFVECANTPSAVSSMPVQWPDGNREAGRFSQAGPEPVRPPGLVSQREDRQSSLGQGMANKKGTSRDGSGDNHKMWEEDRYCKVRQERLFLIKKLN